MKKYFTLFALFSLIACGGNSSDPAPDPSPEPEPTPSVIPAPAFALGADIGWASEMEAAGHQFKLADGTQAPLLTVLGASGVNAIRLRVWVDPYKGWSGKADVLKVAQEVTKAGLALMIDFHYSDFFADPGRQMVPSAWANASLNELCQKVAEHTTDVLQALKEAGVQVHWVQIGNETRNGMLWPAGQLWNSSGDIPDGRKHFARLYNAGYDAAKAIYPGALVMPHIDNAFADNDWWFRQVKEAGAKFDAIALSHYPQNSYENNKLIAWKDANTRALTQIKKLAANYKVPVIVAEVGVKQMQSDAVQALSAFMTEVRKISDCKGVFYWEPEMDGTWKPELYGNVTELRKYSGDATTGAWGPYDQGAFTTGGQPSAVFDAFVK